MDGLTYYHYWRWFHYDTLLINNFTMTATDKDHVAEKKTNLWIEAFYS